MKTTIEIVEKKGRAPTVTIKRGRRKPVELGNVTIEVSPHDIHYIDVGHRQRGIPMNQRLTLTGLLPIRNKSARI